MSPTSNPANSSHPAFPSTMDCFSMYITTTPKTYNNQASDAGVCAPYNCNDTQSKNPGMPLKTFAVTEHILKVAQQQLSAE